MKVNEEGSESTVRRVKSVLWETAKALNYYNYTLDCFRKLELLTFHSGKGGVCVKAGQNVKRRKSN